MLRKVWIAVCSLASLLLTTGCLSTYLQSPGQVTAPTPQTGPAQTADPFSTPEGVARAFLGWYLSAAQAAEAEGTVGPLGSGAYQDSEFLSSGFVTLVDTLRAEYPDGVPLDPFVCAPMMPEAYQIESILVSGGQARLVVRTNLHDHIYLIKLAPANNTWQIDDTACGVEPAGTVEIFYTWYLGYIGDRSDGQFRNPLSDRAYHHTGLLTPGFVAEVDRILDGFGPNSPGYDPLLLAQDVPVGFEVLAGTMPNTVIVDEQFSGGVRSVQVHLQQSDGRWLIDAVQEVGAPAPTPVAEIPPTPGEGAAEPTPEGPGMDEPPAETPPAGETVVDDEYGWRFDAPEGWVVSEFDLDMPGMPPSGPLMRSWQVMPVSIAERMAGAPNPNEIVVAPVQVDVVVGDEEALRWVFPPPEESEAVTINGYAASRTWESPGIVRYVFQHPSDATVWVVVTDWVNEFPGREALVDEGVGGLETVLNSIVFDE